MTIALLLGFIFSGIQGEAQNITWSEDFKMNRKDRTLSMLGADDNQLFILRKSNTREPEFILEVLDSKTMKIATSVDVKMPMIGENPTRLEDFLVTKEHLVLFSSYFDKTDSRLRCYGTIYNKQGAALDLPILIGDVPSKARRVGSPFNFELSPDSTLILAHYGTSLERKGNERFTLKVFDEALETEWEKDIELPYLSEIIEITQHLVDNDGQVYMMSGISGDKSTSGSERRLSDKRYVLFSYDPALNKLKEFEVALNNKWVMSTTFGITDDGDLAIGGFFSNDRVFSISGTFYFRIEGKSKEIVAKGLHDFDSEFLKQFMSDRRAEKGRELYDFYFDHFTIHADGGASFVAEQYYVMQRYRSDITTGRQQMLYYYNYNDIILVRFNPDGSLAFTKKVPKEQTSINDKGPYSSYAFSMDADSLFLLFNDDPGNTAFLKEKPNASPRTYSGNRKGVVVKVSVGKDGEIQRENLFSNNEVLLRPKTHIMGPQGELYLYAQYRKQYRFGKIEFSP